MVDILLIAFFVIIAFVLIFQIIPALFVAWGLLAGIVGCWLARKGFFGGRPGG